MPKLHYIYQGETPKQHIENIQQTCVSGEELVQLRLPGLSEKKVLKITKDFDKTLSFNKLLNASSTQEQPYHFE